MLELSSVSSVCECPGVCGAMNLQGHKVHLAYGGCIAQVWKPEGDAKGQQCQ